MEKHGFDRTEYEARKASATKVKAGHATAQNVPQLRAIVTALAEAVGMVPTPGQGN